MTYTICHHTNGNYQHCNSNANIIIVIYNYFNLIFHLVISVQAANLYASKYTRSYKHKWVS